MDDDYQQGDFVWVKDPEYVWILGKIAQVSDPALDYVKPSYTCQTYFYFA